MLKLVNKVLYRPAKPVDVDYWESVVRTGKEMLAYIRTRGYGLAAPQIGVSKRFFVMNVDGIERIIINPTIVDNSSPFVSMEEGCLSFPGKRIMVDRPANIVVSYEDGLTKGMFDNIHVACLPMDGMEARCFLHEYDHLNGVTMFQHQRG